MDAKTREYFDRQLDHVLAHMPDQVHRLLDEVPMYVDDHPSREVMQRLGISDRRQLCGLYTGIPLGSRSVQHSGVLSDAVHVYREGVLELARNSAGHIDQKELRRQIGITILHELGHLHGFGERELEDLGY